MRNFIPVAVLLLSLISRPALAADDDFFEVEAVGRYPVAAGASIELAKNMAFYIAKRQAVDLAGRYLSRKGLIEVYELNRDEIYSLTAREIAGKIFEKKRQTVGKTSFYLVRIKARIQASDFIKAEMEDARQAKREVHESFAQEMEQVVSAGIDPGKDISKAYRLQREKKWRIAMIYPKHLEKKYPGWD